MGQGYFSGNEAWRPDSPFKDGPERNRSLLQQRQLHIFHRSFSATRQIWCLKNLYQDAHHCLQQRRGIAWDPDQILDNF